MRKLLLAMVLLSWTQYATQTKEWVGGTRQLIEVAKLKKEEKR